MGVLQRLGNSLSHAFNAFSTQDTQAFQSWGFGSSAHGTRPDRVRARYVNDKTIVTSIFTQLAIDAAAIPIYHVDLDPDNDFRYKETRWTSKFNYCLTQEANIDEGARAFRQNIVRTLCEKGIAVIVPVDTTDDPTVSMAYDILTMRVAEVVEWYPKDVRVLLYNEAKGLKEEITLSKSQVAIVENPLYDVMNESNSVLKRLVRKLSLLDLIDEQSSSGKLDLIIQLPYVIKTEAKKQQAEQRRKDIEEQMTGSKYGIAYTDGTERITQLNRPAENNMLEQVDKLTAQLYSQLGLSVTVFEGTADEATMTNYRNRTLEPILTAITEAMHRSFLSKTARTQGQAVRFYPDPFKNVPIKDMAEIADKFSRNEIFSPNEIRSAMGARPSKDSKADKLLNSNMPTQKPAPAATAVPVVPHPNGANNPAAGPNQQPSDLTQGRKDLIQNGSSNSN